MSFLASPSLSFSDQQPSPSIHCKSFLNLKMWIYMGQPGKFLQFLLHSGTLACKIFGNKRTWAGNLFYSMHCFLCILARVKCVHCPWPLQTWCPLLTAFFSHSLCPSYFSPRRSYHRVLKFCMLCYIWPDKGCAAKRIPLLDGGPSRVCHAQTWEWGPPSVPAEIVWN